MRKPISAIAAVAAVLGAAGPAAAEALPQLEPKNFSPQIVWLVISFIILYVLMWRLALPRISQVLEERQRRIEGNLQRAESLRAETLAVSTAYDQALAGARATAQDMMAEVRATLAADASARHAELAKRMEAHLVQAEQRIADAKTKALSNLRVIAVEVAGEAAARLTGEKVATRSVGSAVDAILKERK